LQKGHIVNLSLNCLLQKLHLINATQYRPF